jgi:hypothetical protein
VLPQVAMQMAAIIPVILNSDICHQSIHPLVPYLKPYTRRRMSGVVRVLARPAAARTWHP